MSLLSKSLIAFGFLLTYMATQLGSAIAANHSRSNKGSPIKPDFYQLLAI